MISKLHDHTEKDMVYLGISHTGFMTGKSFLKKASRKAARV